MMSDVAKQKNNGPLARARAEHRFGRFYVDRMLIDDPPEVLEHVFRRVVVVACSYDYMSGCMVYDAYSPHFRPVAEAERAPTYEAIMHPDGIVLWQEKEWSFRMR